MKTAVVVTSQAQINEIRTPGFPTSYEDMKRVYPTESVAMNINGRSHCSIGWYLREGYEIISYDTFIKRKNTAKTFETLAVGDIVYQKGCSDQEKEVVFANGEKIITRDLWDGTNYADNIDADDFEDFYVIKGSESAIKELTLEEIATKFGIDVKNVRIKE